MQSQIYTYFSVSSIIERVTEVAKETDLSLYNKFKANLSEDPVLKEAIKRIAPLKSGSLANKKGRPKSN